MYSWERDMSAQLFYIHVSQIATSPALQVVEIEKDSTDRNHS
jgi:hypothetical protein